MCFPLCLIVQEMSNQLRVKCIFFFLLNLVLARERGMIGKGP